MNIERMIGQTFTSVADGGDTLDFIGEDKSFRFYHEQECCESVYVDDVVGDLSDLVGSPLLQAAEITDEMPDPGPRNPNGYNETYQWTFYRFSTIKGTVVVKWYGESDYYSTSVSMKDL